MEYLMRLSIFHYLPSACNWLLKVLRKAINLLFEKVACVVCLLHVTPFMICNTAGTTLITQWREAVKFCLPSSDL
jgi:hypothetical protein